MIVTKCVNKIKKNVVKKLNLFVILLYLWVVVRVINILSNLLLLYDKKSEVIILGRMIQMSKNIISVNPESCSK